MKRKNFKVVRLYWVGGQVDIFQPGSSGVKEVSIDGPQVIVEYEDYEKIFSNVPYEAVGNEIGGNKPKN